jgi:hypothetical protein
MRIKIKYNFILKILMCLINSFFCLYSQENHNYAEALQKSLYFYDAEKCGIGVKSGLLKWRGDCHTEDARIPLTTKTTNLSQDFINKNKENLDPDNDSCIDVSGGFHDAGDHVKFGLPQTYAASTLGWGLYEFKDAFIKIDEYEHIKNILRWFADYFLKSAFYDDLGNIVAFCYQVGDGTVDHTYWGPPELQLSNKYPRPVYFATKETPASDQAAGASAALALMYLNFKNEDTNYSDKCLKTAKDLYDFAKANRGLGFSGGFYNSSYDEDELSWAAIWLYIATNNSIYLEDIIKVDETGKYVGWLAKIINSREDKWQNIWVHSWDVVWGGVFIVLSYLTNNDFFDYIARWNIEYWSGITHQEQNDNNYLKKTPGGFSFLTVWGSARYNTAAQLCALVYHKHKNRTDFADWAKSQMDYILGNNPLKRSYVVGYSSNYAKHPHHRAAHGSTTNSMDDPPEHRHILWGALVGGPGANDEHNDVTSDYVYNEVAIDYNAAFVGALAGLVTYYGQNHKPLVSFPPVESDTLAYYVESKLEQENSERTQLTIRINNISSFPPHFEDSISIKYFFSIEELFPYNQGINDISFQVMYDEQKSSYEGAVNIRGPFVWNLEKGVYYIEIDWSGYKIFGKRDIQVALVAKQDANWKSHWDPQNDWSRQGITNSFLINPHICLYLGKTKVFGEEPQNTYEIMNKNYQILPSPHELLLLNKRAKELILYCKNHNFNVVLYTVLGKKIGSFYINERSTIKVPSNISGCVLIKILLDNSIFYKKIFLR